MIASMVALLLCLALVALLYGCSMSSSFEPEHRRREELDQAMGRMSRMSIG